MPRETLSGQPPILEQPGDEEREGQKETLTAQHLSVEEQAFYSELQHLRDTDPTKLEKTLLKASALGYLTAGLKKLLEQENENKRLKVWWLPEEKEIKDYKKNDEYKQEKREMNDAIYDAGSHRWENFFEEEEDGNQQTLNEFIPEYVPIEELAGNIVIEESLLDDYYHQRIPQEKLGLETRMFLRGLITKNEDKLLKSLDENQNLLLEYYLTSPNDDHRSYYGETNVITYFKNILKIKNETIRKKMAHIAFEGFTTRVDASGDETYAPPLSPFEILELGSRNLGDLLLLAQFVLQDGTEEEKKVVKNILQSLMIPHKDSTWKEVFTPYSTGERVIYTTLKTLLLDPDGAKGPIIDFLTENKDNIPEQTGLIAGIMAEFPNFQATIIAINLLDIFGFEQMNKQKMSQTFMKEWKNTGLTDKGELERTIERNLKNWKKLEEDSPGSTQQLYKEFGISNFGNYPVHLLLRQLETKDDLQIKYGLVVSPKSDWNGAFAKPKMFAELAEQLDDEYCLRFFECGTVDRLARALLYTKRHYADKEGGRKMSFAIIGGHGSPNSINLGNRGEWSRLDSSHLRGKGSKKIPSLIEPGGTVILKSCSTGAEGGIGQKLSEILGEQITLIAPNTPTAMNKIEVKKVNESLVFTVQYSNEEAGKEYTAGKLQEKQ